MNSLTHITNALKSHIQKLYPDTNLDYSLTLNVDHQRQQFGDLSCNAAMLYAKELKSNPRAIAQAIIQDFQHEYVKNIEIAGAGFINIFLKPDFFITTLQELNAQKDSFFSLQARLAENTARKQNFNIEFVSANPTGPLHIGHGRGGIIGDVLGTILRFLGHDVTKEFYINDAGAQIEKLGNSFKIRCQQLLGKAAELPEDGYHGEYLTELAQEAFASFGEDLASKPDSFFSQYAQDYLLQKIKENLAAYGIIYDTWFSEKTLHASGAIQKSLEILQKNGFLYEKEGALWLQSTAFGDDKDRVVKRANGELTYVAADIAYLENKLERGADKIIMVLGQDHHSYVMRLKAVLQALHKDPAMLDVILYQLVTIKEGGQAMRLSKRAGRIVSLEDIIEAVGKDVARFFYLHRKADAHLEFDITLALTRTDENPVYYIQYAYVRTLSILEKAATNTELANITSADSATLTEKEHLLLKKIVSLKLLLEDISHHYQTHLLTYYLYDLAQLFHNYYGNTKVIDATNIPVTRARLLVIMQLRDTFNLCLRLLGVSTPDKM